LEKNFTAADRQARRATSGLRSLSPLKERRATQAAAGASVAIAPKYAS